MIAYTDLSIGELAVLVIGVLFVAVGIAMIGRAGR